MRSVIIFVQRCVNLQMFDTSNNSPHDEILLIFFSEENLTRLQLVLINQKEKSNNSCVGITRNTRKTDTRPSPFSGHFSEKSEAFPREVFPIAIKLRGCDVIVVRWMKIPSMASGCWSITYIIHKRIYKKAVGNEKVNLLCVKAYALRKNARVHIKYWIYYYYVKIT